MAFRRTPKYVVEWTPRGYVFHIQDEELDLVVRLFAELRALVLSDDPQHAPLMRRLFPPAYHLSDDAEAETEYQRLMRDELVASRLESIGAVEKAMSVGAPLDDAAMEGFVRSLNSVRLVLGTLLDVGESHDPAAVRDDDPMVGEHHLYTFLSWLLECAVDAINRSGTSRS
jgi:hypothetical protein